MYTWWSASVRRSQVQGRVVGEFQQRSWTPMQMVAVGHQAYVISHTNQFVNVQAFTDEVTGLRDIPVVDAAIGYDCPYSGETYILALKNALCVPSMSHNLVPPFILREAGLRDNDKPKIHCKDPSVENHSLFHEESGLRIPFTMDETLTVFPTRALTDKEIEQAEVYSTIYLTPDSHKWDPHDESCKINEDPFLNCNGDMVIPSLSSNNDLISKAKMTAALVECDDNDTTVSAIDTVIQSACGSSVS